MTSAAADSTVLPQFWPDLRMRRFPETGTRLRYRCCASRQMRANARRFSQHDPHVFRRRTRHKCGWNAARPTLTPTPTHRFGPYCFLLSSVCFLTPDLFHLSARNDRCRHQNRYKHHNGSLSDHQWQTYRAMKFTLVSGRLVNGYISGLPSRLFRIPL